MTDTTDPAASLEGKINAFADSLSPDELTVLHDVIHLAYEGSEVQGFAMPKPVGLTGNPCDGGEVTFPGTFSLLANLHVSLHRPPRAQPPGPPA